MRILVISSLCPPYYLGGYEIACLNVAKGLVARGHEVRLLTTESHLPGSSDPPWVERCLSSWYFDPDQLRQFDELKHFDASCSNYSNTAAILRQLRAFDPDLVYCWNLLGIGGLAIIDVLNTVGVPWALHLMDCLPVYLAQFSPIHVRHIFDAGGSSLYARGKIIAMSDHLLAEIDQKIGVRFDNGVEIVPGWVDTSGLGAPRTARQSDIARFVSSGIIAPHKGIDIILEATAALVARGSKKFEIDFFGDGQVTKYVEMAMQLGVGDRVRFLGGRSQVELLKEYTNYDAFLFPTWEREPFGFAPIEAAACGCVPIMTRNCGASERLVDGIHCIKIERNAAALTDAMNAIMNGTLDVRKMGAAAAALVRSDLNFDRCLDKIESILASVRRDWSRAALQSEKALLLAYVKHHLARAMRFDGR